MHFDADRNDNNELCTGICRMQFNMFIKIFAYSISTMAGAASDKRFALLFSIKTSHNLYT